MVQATTPTFLLTLPIDLSDLSSMVFTITQGETKINKRDSELQINGQVVSVYLTQEETMCFKKGSAKIQLNWLYQDGSRGCSDIATIDVTPNLLLEVLE